MLSRVNSRWSRWFGSPLIVVSRIVAESRWYGLWWKGIAIGVRTSRKNHYRKWFTVRFWLIRQK